MTESDYADAEEIDLARTYLLGQKMIVRPDCSEFYIDSWADVDGLTRRVINAKNSEGIPANPELRRLYFKINRRAYSVKGNRTARVKTAGSVSPWVSLLEELCREEEVKEYLTR